MIQMARARILNILEGAVQRFSGQGRAGETFTSREMFQHYGFTSRPQAGAEGVVFIKGNQVFLIATEDRRFRPNVEKGETAIYTDEGDIIRLKRGNKIEIISAGKVTVTAPEITVNGNATINGNVEVDGTIHATGDITGDGSILATVANSNLHSHS